jgi:spore germination cell wall hydrolase CwlJ-like protein
MGRSQIGWAMGVVAPWCLGIGLIVSITADAGQDATVNGSFVPIAVRALAEPSLLIPPIAAPRMTDLVHNAEAPFGDVNREFVQEASLTLGSADDFKAGADEQDPRADLKHNARTFPQIDRTHKGEPVVGLRPTFETKLRRVGGLALIRADDLIFNHDENSPTGGFSAMEDENSGPESVQTFEPWNDGETPTTAQVSAATNASPGQKGTTGSGTGSIVTMRPASVNERLMQGATPKLPRATALASTTPAPADAIPFEIVSLSKNSSMSAIETPTSDRPNYAALIDEDKAGREKRCLAEGIYFEARSEPEEGQAAVAQVILNRVASGLYPSTICGVVYQNRNRYHACQFSFACEGKSLRITEPESWQTATRIAASVMDGKTYLSDVGGSTHYHANYVKPRWARQLEKMDVIGHHIFYKLRPGQT